MADLSQVILCYYNPFGSALCNQGWSACGDFAVIILFISYFLFACRSWQRHALDQVGQVPQWSSARVTFAVFFACLRSVTSEGSWIHGVDLLKQLELHVFLLNSKYLFRAFALDEWASHSSMSSIWTELEFKTRSSSFQTPNSVCKVLFVDRMSDGEISIRGLKTSLG